MKNPFARRAQTGVSLIEALVALAVMAFGMLGVVGMQTALRSNADVSRQRAEAVRIAQQEVERLRNFSVLRNADAASGQLAFETLDSLTESPAVRKFGPEDGFNSTFTLETAVAEPETGDPLLRHLRVYVNWTDRRDQPQSVELSTMIAGVPPEAAALSAMRMDHSPVQQPFGRHSAIPAGALDNGNGTSSFTPPGSPGARWVFNNSSGLITQICPTPETCTASNRWLLSGTVAFATGGTPLPEEAEAPGDPIVTLSMRVDLMEPSSSPDEPCATQIRGTSRLDYYCALPTQTTGGERVWSGRMLFSDLSKANALSDSGPNRYKVCRYTPDARQIDALADVPASESLVRYNAGHPRTYLRVSGPLQNKNFLVISAGNGSTAFSCPGDGPSTLVESMTWPHDPSV